MDMRKLFNRLILSFLKLLLLFPIRWGSRTFVLFKLYGWIIAPAYGVRPITIWESLGLISIAVLIRNIGKAPDPEEDIKKIEDTSNIEKRANAMIEKIDNLASDMVTHMGFLAIVLGIGYLASQFI